MVQTHNLPYNNEYFVRSLDDFPQVLLLLLNFKVLKSNDFYISTCSIEFLVTLNYPAITNIFCC